MKGSAAMRRLTGRGAVFGAACLWTAVAQAQFGRGPGEWTTAGADAQRTAWMRTDAKISRDNLQKPGFDFIWKVKVDSAAKQPSAPPIQLDRYIGYRGFRSLAFVGVSSDKVVGIDTDLGRIEWQKQLTPAGQSACAGATLALTRPTAAALPTQPAGRGGAAGARGGARSAVGESGEGAVTMQEIAARAARGPAPGAAPAAGAAPGRGAVPGRGGAGGFGRMANALYTVTSDGMLHTMLVSNGEPSQPPIRFVPPDSHVEGLIVVGNVAYAAAGSGCNAAPNSVVALDLESKEVNVFKPESGAIAGSVGPAFGPDGTLYVATTAGDVIALEAKTLKVKDSYSAGEPFSTTPVIFDWKGKILLVAAAKSGALHMLDTASPAGADRKTPLYKSTGGPAATALASWQDPQGTRWLLASTAGGVTAWKVADQNGAPSLQSGWTSRDLVSPLAPAIVNGVAFTASTGSAPVLYAFDASTGKDLWNSGRKIASPLHGGGVSAGNSQIYLGTDDGTLYVFGFPIEH